MPDLQIARAERMARDIHAFELRDPTGGELAALHAQIEAARAELAGLRHDIAAARAQLAATPSRLVELNEQLVVAALRAQTDAERAASALEVASRSAEFDALIAQSVALEHALLQQEPARP